MLLLLHFQGFFCLNFILTTVCVVNNSNNNNNFIVPGNIWWLFSRTVLYTISFLNYRAQLVSTFASYSRSSGFESRSGNQLTSVGYSRISLVPLDTCRYEDEVVFVFQLSTTL
jgi:hypothetical protein